MFLKKGIKVKVRVGKDKGKTGEIIEINRSKNLAKVKEVNMVKKHIKTTKEKKGGIITMEKPINISNLVLMNNKTKPAVKIDKKIKDKKITTKQKTKSKKK